MTTTSSFTRMPETENYLAGGPIREDSLLDGAGNPDFAAIRENPDFVRVQRRLARFVFPMCGLFLFWYMTYVLLAAYAHDFMGHRLFGNITVGLLLGLSQFVTTIVIMVLYSRFAKRHIDPEVARLRERARRS
jgi:uncharacterized membrane protein (DUF485 family)